LKEKSAAAVGDRASILLFKAAGIPALPAENRAEAEKAVFALAKDGYRVIFLTENIALALEEELKRFKFAPYPIIVPVPGQGGSMGLGLKALNKNMEKAIGTNIFDKD
jgi:V/A-type H+-transporting ATPase subunit F